MKAKTKDTAIIAKIDETTKKEFLKVAENNKRTQSDYLRLLIEHAIKNKLKF